MNIGPTEIIIVLAIALLVLGPSKLPQMGRSLGKGIREFKNAAETAKTELGLDGVLDEVNSVKDDITSSLGVDELKAGIDNVKTSMGVSEIAAGVGGVKSAIANPAKAAKDAVMSKPSSGAKGKPEEATDDEAIAEEPVVAAVDEKPADLEATAPETETAAVGA